MTTRITDLFGRKLSTDTDTVIILIHIKKTSSLVTNLLELPNSNFGIYRISSPPGLDRYLSMGDLLLKNDWDHLMVPLVNKHNHQIKSVSTFDLLNKLENGTLWNPVDDKNKDYVNIGCFYSKDHTLPAMSVGLVHKNLIIESVSKLKGIGQLNEYRFLGYHQTLRTIDRLAVVTQNDLNMEDDITEELHDWTPVEGTDVVLKIPEEKWFENKPERKRTAPNTSANTTSDHSPNTATMMVSAVTPMAIASSDNPNSYMGYSPDYYGVTLTMITIIVAVYYMSIYVQYCMSYRADN